MNTLTKLALGVLGQLHGQPASGAVLGEMALPPARTTGGLPLMQALQQRQSQRDFLPDALALQTLSDLLWAAAGINRTEHGGHTWPSAMNAQEVDLYVALPQGLYRYDADTHALQRIVAADVRRVTGYQDFVDSAPLDLVSGPDGSREQHPADWVVAMQACFTRIDPALRARIVALSEHHANMARQTLLLNLQQTLQTPPLVRANSGDVDGP